MTPVDALVTVGVVLGCAALVGYAAGMLYAAVVIHKRSGDQ